MRGTGLEQNSVNVDSKTMKILNFDGLFIKFQVRNETSEALFGLKAEQ